MKILIADLVTELNPRYENNIRLAEPFLYNGERKTDIKLSVSDKYLDDLMSRAVEGTTVEQMENYAFCCEFNRKLIPYNAMSVHSSALIFNGGAYLFSGASGSGKSTHTKLWLEAYGEKVHIMNDDKPVVRLYPGKAIAYGTPFDGGSGIALNESYPLKAIVFIERGGENSIRIPENKEIVQKLYFQTAHMVDAETADKMLSNIEQLLDLTRFYVLTCVNDISAAYFAYNSLMDHH